MLFVFCINNKLNFCSTDNMPENIALAASHIPYMNLMPVYGKWTILPHLDLSAVLYVSDVEIVWSIFSPIPIQ